MAKTQFAVQMGMGTDLNGQDYTKAEARAVHDALHIAATFSRPATTATASRPAPRPQRKTERRRQH